MILGPLPHPTPHLQKREKSTPEVMKPQTPPEVPSSPWRMTLPEVRTGLKSEGSAGEHTEEVPPWEPKDSHRGDAPGGKPHRELEEHRLVTRCSLLTGKEGRKAPGCQGEEPGPELRYQALLRHQAPSCWNHFII